MHNRRSIRLKEFDYTQPGAYFVTVCTWMRENLFGYVVDGEVRLNERGHIVKECWNEIPEHFQQVDLDSFVVMPNHIHGIIVINGNDVVVVRNRDLRQNHWGQWLGHSNLRLRGG
jgi:REP element-mobilizing transposase RayT